MSGRMISFSFTVIVFFASLVAVAWYYYRRRAPNTTWEILVSRLIALDRDAVEKIALDAITETGERRQDEHALELEPEEVWHLIGGLKGVEALEHNSKVLIDMASYIEKWYPEALETADELRLSAREIEWHVSRLRAASETGKLEILFHTYAQDAVASYYIMTRNLLAMYQRGNFEMFANLQRTI